MAEATAVAAQPQPESTTPPPMAKSDDSKAIATLPPTSNYSFKFQKLCFNSEDEGFQFLYVIIRNC